MSLRRRKGIALVLDETYRDFDSRTGAPHDLFGDPDWRGTLVHLYSFSKAFRLTGHRVGAMIADAARLAEVEKFLDTVAICPNQLGQIGALWGLRNLSQWVAGERAEILARRAALEAGFAGLPDWRAAWLRRVLCLCRTPLSPARARPRPQARGRGGRPSSSRHHVPPGGRRRWREGTSHRLRQYRGTRHRGIDRPPRRLSALTGRAALLRPLT